MSDYQDKKVVKEFLEKYKDSVSNIEEMLEGEPTKLFYLWLRLFGYLMDNDPDNVISKKGIERRQKLASLVRKAAEGTMSNKIVHENRNELLLDKDDKRLYVPADKGIQIPDEPAIWVANHAFKDDTAASISTIPRQASILFGSLPQFYNTTDGFTGWLIGVAMVNRMNKNSRAASLEKCKKIMEYGGDIFMFPEGTLGRTPNRLVGDMWPGFYKLAKETGAKIIPMVHYMSDPTATNNPNVLIHTVLDDPIDVSNMSEEEAISLVREKMATWFYLMMERYGVSTREKELEGFDNAHDAWCDKLNRRIATVGKYNRDTENKVSYHPRDIINPQDVWEPIANSQNDPNREYAKDLVRTRRKEDYQNNF